jgi:hypothetical protein
VYTRTSCGCRIAGRAHGALDGNLAQLDFAETVSGCSQRAARRGRAFAFFQRVPGRPLALFGGREYLVEVDTRENGTAETEWRDGGSWQARQLGPGATALDDVDACP